ncbi:MAG: hypothetical protein ABWX88_07050 [Pseudoxanthomonas sp.]
MATTIKQACPLCDAAGEYTLVDHDRYKHFTCPDCVSFRISIRAELVIFQGPKRWRSSYAYKARQGPRDHVLILAVPPPSHGGGPASVTVSGLYRHRSELAR